MPSLVLLYLGTFDIQKAKVNTKPMLLQKLLKMYLKQIEFKILLLKKIEKCKITKEKVHGRKRLHTKDTLS